MPYPAYFPAYNLPRAERPNPGSFTRVLYAPVEDVQAFPLYNTIFCEAEDVPLLKPGKLWHQGQLIKNGYQEAEKEADPGNFVETTVRAFLPWDDKRNSKTIDHMKHQRFILIIEHCRRFCRIVGNIENPVKLSFGFDTGEKRNETSGTSLTWFWKSEDRPLICSTFVRDSLIQSTTPYSTGGAPETGTPPKEPQS